MLSHMLRATIGAALAGIAIVGCSAERPGDESTSGVPGVEREVLVAHFQVPCAGVGAQDCLLVRESADAEWEMRYDPIVGFEYEPGFEYRLAVREEPVENPPADGSSTRWTLIETLAATPVQEGASSGIQVGGIWVLESFGPAAALGEEASAVEEALAGLPAARPVTLDLTEPGRVAGHAGCNNYFADFRAENGHRFTTGPVGATRKACAEGLMALEQAYFQVLDAATMVFVSGDELELHGAAGPVMVFRRLESVE